MNGALGAAAVLSSYREGRAILEAEDLRKNKDFKHWEDRKDYYRRETINIEGEPKDWRIGPRVIYSDDDSIRFWNHLRSTFSRIKPPERQFEDLSHLLTTPPRSPIASISKKRARQSSTATRYRPMTKNARGTTKVIGCGKESNGTGGAVENTTTAGEGVDGRSSRSAGRHESKNAYRRCTNGAKVKPSHEHTLAKDPPNNGLTTPDSGKPSNGRVGGEDDRVYCPRFRNRAAVKGLSRATTRTEPNAYLTPESPQSCKAGVHKRLKRTKGSKRRSNKNGAYRGLRSVLQAEDPVSSRLRSSGIRLDEEVLSIMTRH